MGGVRMARIIDLIKSVARSLGAEVVRSGLATRADLRLRHVLARLQPNAVLDVGANIGQFSAALIGGGWSGRIISFEALPDAHAALVARAVAHSGWRVAPRAALADKTGEADFHVTASDTASSLFPTTSEGRAAYPVLGQSAVLRVPMRRLDDVMDELGEVSANYFLKLDVQGAEALVLAGGPQTLSRASAIMCEMQTSPLYDGQGDWRTIDALLTAQDFVLWDIDPFFRSPATGRLENADFFYVRRTHLDRCL